MNLDELLKLEEPDISYQDLLYKQEAYDIISCCLAVHNELGPGFSEVIYKDALEIELNTSQVPFEREKKFEVTYKSFRLRRNYACDFIVFDKIVLEIKSQKFLTDADTGQLMNYLAVSGCALGLLINFGEPSLKFKRVILSSNLNKK